MNTVIISFFNSSNQFIEFIDCWKKKEKWKFSFWWKQWWMKWIVLLAPSIEELHSSNYGVMGYKFVAPPALIPFTHCLHLFLLNYERQLMVGGEKDKLNNQSKRNEVWVWRATKHITNSAGFSNFNLNGGCGKPINLHSIWLIEEKNEWTRRKEMFFFSLL